MHQRMEGLISAANLDPRRKCLDTPRDLEHHMYWVAVSICEPSDITQAVVKATTAAGVE
jgi:hypothetical protein